MNNRNILRNLYLFLFTGIIMTTSVLLFAQDTPKDEGKKNTARQVYEDINQAKKELETVKKQVDEAKTEYNKVKTQVDEAKALANNIKEGDLDAVLKSRLSPDTLLLGLFPNTDGFMDGKASLNKNYLGFLNSGADVTYSTMNDTANIENKLESSTIRKELLAKAQALGFQYPLQLGNIGFIGFKIAAGAMYIYNKNTTSGYRVEQGETVYFNSIKNMHNVTPSADAEINMVLTRYFNMHLTGGYLPYVFIMEKGRKLYSSYDSPITYSLRNSNTGYHVELTMSVTDLLIGDFELFGKFMNYSGDYQTRQELVTGNYRTTIKTYSENTRRMIDIGINYALTFVGNYISYIPILSLTYSQNYEKLGDSVLFDEGVYKLGVMVRMK